jgi:hypothetical protein
MSKPGKPTVDLKDAPKVSRIRRDPVTSEKPQGLVGKVYFQSREAEIWMGVLGIVAFAVALNVIWIAVSAWVKL